MALEMTTAHVLIAEQISDHDTAALVAGCESIGITADVRDIPPRRSLSEAAWLLLMVLPLQHFFGRLAEDAADDIHERLRGFVHQVMRRQPAKPEKRVLVLQDADTGLEVVLEPDLPAESYRQLLSFDLTTVRRGPLHYDRRHRRWRSELDEQGGPPPPAISG